MHNLRITAGIYKGRKIATPGGKTHPMGERERLALFNMLTSYVQDAKVLDAYAGSGALGIEALSRGASEVMFIEKSQKACRQIQNNLRNLKVSGKICPIDVTDFTTAEKFDLILADPPYDDYKIQEVTHLLQFLQEDGIFVLSHPEEAPELSGLQLLKSHSYAAAHISLYKKS